MARSWKSIRKQTFVFRDPVMTAAIVRPHGCRVGTRWLVVATMLALVAAVAPVPAFATHYPDSAPNLTAHELVAADLRAWTTSSSTSRSSGRWSTVPAARTARSSSRTRRRPRSTGAGAALTTTTQQPRL